MLVNGWKTVANAAAALIVVASLGLYLHLGSPNLPSSNGAKQSQPSANTEIDDMLAKINARLQSNPNDGEAWHILGLLKFNLQKYAQAADAYAKAIEIDPANIDNKSALAEALVQAAGGIVTPKAQSLIAEVLTQTPKDFRGRFYDAMAHEQAGDQSGAYARWQALLADSPADAPWLETAQQHAAATKPPTPNGSN